MHNNEYEQSPKSKNYVSYSWAEVWTAALTKPSTETFERLLEDVNATRDRAFKWVFVSGTIALLISVIATLFILPSGYFSTVLTSLLCMIVLGGPILLLVFIIQGGITQFIARALGGAGSYSDFFYANSSFASPLRLINAVLILFPTGGASLGLLNLAIFFYELILTAMALRAVNRFSWGKAIGTLAITIAVFAVFFACLLSFVGTSLLTNSTY